MKLTWAIILSCAVAVYGQGQTFTEELLASQADLSLGHEFFETTLFLNRGQISAYLYRINREIIDSHINTYAFVKNTAYEVRDEFDSLPSNENNVDCLNNVRNRWELQINRYGHRLATCVNKAYRLIREWNEFLDGLHATAQVTGNQVQNLGLKVLSETEIFDGRNSFGDLINREFRMLLLRARPYRDRIEGFLEEVSLEILDTIRELISCDEVLEEDFSQEIYRDLARGRNCVGLSPEGTVPPVPT